MNEILLWFNGLSAETKEILIFFNGLAVGMWIGSTIQEHFDKKKGGSE